MAYNPTWHVTGALTATQPLTQAEREELLRCLTETVNATSAYPVQLTHDCFDVNFADIDNLYLRNDFHGSLGNLFQPDRLSVGQHAQDWTSDVNRDGHEDDTNQTQLTDAARAARRKETAKRGTGGERGQGGEPAVSSSKGNKDGDGNGKKTQQRKQKKVMKQH